jgi:hypothetical protein
VAAAPVAAASVAAAPVAAAPVAAASPLPPVAFWGILILVLVAIQ